MKGHLQPGGSSGGRAVPRQLTPDEIDDFYRRYYRQLVRYVTCKHRFSEEDARDVAQDAFVLAMEKMESEGNAKAWFIEVVDRLSANLRRKMTRRADLLARWG